MARSSSKRQPSVWNWMGTLILYAIPGVNFIFLIMSVIFAKSTSKRGFAIAGLVLMLLCALMTFLAFMFFPDYFGRLAEAMRQTMRPVQVVQVAPVI